MAWSFQPWLISGILISFSQFCRWHLWQGKTPVFQCLIFPGRNRGKSPAQLELILLSDALHRVCWGQLFCLKHVIYYYHKENKEKNKPETFRGGWQKTYKTLMALHKHQVIFTYCKFHRMFGLWAIEAHLRTCTNWRTKIRWWAWRKVVVKAVWKAALNQGCSDVMIIGCSCESRVQSDWWQQADRWVQGRV